MQRGAVRLEQVHVTLNGVQVPISSVVEGALQMVPVDRLTLGAVVPWSDLSALSTGRDVQIAPGTTPGEVQVLAAVDVLGTRLTVSAVSSLRLDGRTLVLTARDLKVGPASAPPAVVRALGGDLDLRLPLPPLPYGVQLTQRPLHPGRAGARRHGPAGGAATVTGEDLRPVLSALGVHAGERATLVQFSSAFCTACRGTRRVLHRATDLVPGVAHVEVDAEQHLDLVRRLGVESTPTTLVLDAGGGGGRPGDRDTHRRAGPAGVTLLTWCW